MEPDLGAMVAASRARAGVAEAAAGGEWGATTPENLVVRRAVVRLSTYEAHRGHRDEHPTAGGDNPPLDLGPNQVETRGRRNDSVMWACTVKTVAVSAMMAIEMAVKRGRMNAAMLRG